MGATGAHRLVKVCPVEHGCGSYFGSVKEKSNRSRGSRGLAPLGCLPHWGREGVTFAISTPAQKTPDFYRAHLIVLFEKISLFEKNIVAFFED